MVDTWSVCCTVPLFKSSFGSWRDIGAVAIWEQNSLSLFFILNWQQIHIHNMWILYATLRNCNQNNMVMCIYGLFDLPKVLGGFFGGGGGGVGPTGLTLLIPCRFLNNCLPFSCNTIICVISNHTHAAQRKCEIWVCFSNVSYVLCSYFLQPAWWLGPTLAQAFHMSPAERPARHSELAALPTASLLMSAVCRTLG